jgi:tetratricopeptide (TPR) repeat protein
LRASSLSSIGDVDAGIAALREAKEIQRSLDDPELDTRSAGIELFLCWQTMQLERVIEIDDAQWRLGVSSDAWSRLDASFIGPYANLYCGRPAVAVRQIEERRVPAERIGHQSVLWGLKQASAIEAIRRGDLGEAEAAQRGSIAFGEAMAVGWRFLSVTLLGEVLFLRGRTEEAFTHLREGARTELKSYLSGYAASSLLWALAHEGDPSAESLLLEAPGRLPESGRMATFAMWLSLLARVEALALLGRRDEAAALVAATEALVATGVQYLRSQMCGTVAGVAAACAREWSRAEAHHQRAIRQADESYRVSQPHARFWYADMLKARNASGDRERARSLLSEAVSLYDAMGMPGFARRASARLAETAR